jgi:hypothetical protein
VRQELKLVAEATHVADGVRALCLEHLERRPPGVRPLREADRELAEISDVDDERDTSTLQ